MDDEYIYCMGDEKGGCQKDRGFWDVDMEEDSHQQLTDDINVQRIICIF